MTTQAVRQLAKRMIDKGIGNVPRDQIDDATWAEARALYQAANEDDEPTRERHTRDAVEAENDVAPDEPPSLLPDQPEDPVAMYERLSAESRARGDRM